MPREIGGRTSDNETRTDDETKSVVGERSEKGQEGRIVLKVRIHLKNQVRIQVRQGIGHAPLVRLAEPPSFSCQEMEVAVGPRHFPDEVCRPIR